jgi:hypothetical protein
VALDPSEVTAIDAQASVLMKRGIALMESGRADVIPERWPVSIRRASFGVDCLFARSRSCATVSQPAG